MSDEAENEGAETVPAAAPAKGAGSMLLLIAGLVGGSLGGVAGAYLIAPKLAGGGASQAAAATAEAPATSSASTPAQATPVKLEKKGGKAEPARLYRIDNVIVNPAGSEGTRFLMASVAYQIQDEAAEQMLRAHEIQLRDDVVGALESMTMAKLTQPHARDSIKVQLLDIAHRVLGPQTPVDVFMPQFVIQ